MSDIHVLPVPLNNTDASFKKTDPLSLSVNCILQEYKVLFSFLFKGKIRINSFPELLQIHSFGWQCLFMCMHVLNSLLNVKVSADCWLIRNSALLPYGSRHEKHTSFTFDPLPLFINFPASWILVALTIPVNEIKCYWYHLSNELVDK